MKIRKLKQQLTAGLKTILYAEGIYIYIYNGDRRYLDKIGTLIQGNKRD